MKGKGNIDLLSSRHRIPRELKARGRKIMGYLCAYCPEEILYAAGITPIRVFGSPGTLSHASSNLPAYYCAHARGCLNAGLEGEYDYLDGLIYPNACLHTKGAFDSWRRDFKHEYTWFIDMPSIVNTKEAIDFFSEELRIFCQSLMDAFSVRITDDGLRKAIAFSNGKRQMLKNIYILKKDDLPIVSGEEVFSIILQSMMGGKGEQGLSELLEEIRSRKKADKRPLRVMLIGTEIHDPGIFGAIEGKGEAIVVADTLCTGSRYIWEDVEEDGDPLRAIARHYLFGVNCPLKHPHDRAIAQVEEFIEQFNVEKAIFIWPEACDPMGWIVPFIKDTLDSRGIPSCWITIRGDGSNEDRLEVSREASKFLRGQLTW